MGRTAALEQRASLRTEQGLARGLTRNKKLESAIEPSHTIGVCLGDHDRFLGHAILMITSPS